MHSFYAPDISGEFFTLSEKESKHIKVLRLKNGDNIRLLDGKGSVYTAEIINVLGKKYNVKIIDSKRHNKKSYIFELVVSPPKTSSRLELLIEKICELEVDRLVLIRSNFSERKKVNSERLEKIFIAALKQSQNFFKTELISFPGFDEYITKPFSGTRLIAHCYDRPKEKIQQILKEKTNTQILIGPEGDFSINEIEKAVQTGYTEISLSNARLRTETACIYSAVSVDFINQKQIY